MITQRLLAISRTLTALLLSSLSCIAISSVAQAQNIQEPSLLFFSGNVQGETEPCG